MTPVTKIDQARRRPGNRERRSNAAATRVMAAGTIRRAVITIGGEYGAAISIAQDWVPQKKTVVARQRYGAERFTRFRPAGR
jgi:hypothetical protein